jgi:hypothetical protein
MAAVQTFIINCILKILYGFHLDVFGSIPFKAPPCYCLSSLVEILQHFPSTSRRATPLRTPPETPPTTNPMPNHAAAAGRRR